MSHSQISSEKQRSGGRLGPGPGREQAQQLARILRARIDSGEWLPGHVFAFSQLADEFSLTPSQVIHVVVPAIRTLREEGKVESRSRVGVRVVIEGESWRPGNGESDLPHDEYIEMALRERLHKREYRPGQQFPPVGVLAEEFGVSATTVRKALLPLRRQKILEVRSNITFVSESLFKVPTEDLLRPSVRRKPGRGKFWAFGEQRTLAEWAKDPRCQVNRKVLRSRVLLGWSLERAIQTPKQN
ncbi:GntR family transcriptional regulator [Streptomyces olivaceoviridis]|uniref:GntR family transcriptional regulator n=1 Tax=Streptomyces olivaceoviridis TaxID=1921 RepID=UPI00332B3253